MVDLAKRGGKKKIAFKAFINAKGTCPNDGEEFFRLGIAEVYGRDYLYSFHRRDKRDKICYLGPLGRHKYVINRLEIIEWLAKEGYTPEADFKNIVKQFFDVITKDQITKLDDVLGKSLAMLKAKAKSDYEKKMLIDNLEKLLAELKSNV